MYRQSSHIEMERGASLLWMESFAPGRTAHGEVFEFREMRLETDIWFNGRHLVRERYRIYGAHPAVCALRRKFPSAYYATIICVATMIFDEVAILSEINATFEPESAWVGVSRLGDGAYAAKIVAPDSPTLRRVTQAVRKRFQMAAGFAAPALRRTTAENRA